MIDVGDLCLIECEDGDPDRPLPRIVLVEDVHGDPFSYGDDFDSCESDYESGLTGDIYDC